MVNTERTQQLALLLNLIGEDAVQTAMSGLDESTTNHLNRYIDEFKNDPPTKSEIDFVMEDFERFFSFALQYISDEIETEEETDKDESEKTKVKVLTEEERFEATIESIKTFSKPELTGDSKHDLNLLHPYQVAYALRNDNPNAIAVVLKNLTDLHAASTLESLPPDVRSQVFLRMADPMNVSRKVESQILEATVKSAVKVETRVPEEDRTGQLVTLVRTLPKTIRGELLDKLRETYPDTAEQVKSEMYQFDDISKLEDRDIQKVLAQSDSDSLVLALVDADDSLRNQLLDNMSKRARQTIEDELEFKTNASEEEKESGKRQIVELLVKLDESGEISLA